MTENRSQQLTQGAAATPAVDNHKGGRRRQNESTGRVETTHDVAQRPLPGEAVYLLDVKITCLGAAPERYNRAAPEFSEAMWKAIDAATDALKQAGYEVARTGGGSYRLDDEDGNV